MGHRPKQRRQWPRQELSNSRRLHKQQARVTADTLQKHQVISASQHCVSLALAIQNLQSTSPTKSEKKNLGLHFHCWRTFYFHCWPTCTCSSLAFALPTLTATRPLSLPNTTGTPQKTMKKTLRLCSGIPVIRKHPPGKTCHPNRFTYCACSFWPNEICWM